MAAAAGSALAADARGVEALRAAAARDPKAAIREAAKQFEALFMHELMKSMRAATPSSGLLDNSTAQLGTEMLDTQFAQQMAGLRGGLSEAIAKHLERQMGAASAGAAQGGGASVGAAPVGAAPAAAAAAPGDAANVAPHTLHGPPRRRGDPPVPPTELSSHQIGFVQQHAQAAREAQHTSGIAAHFMLAQAAHESGWGQREIRQADGRSAHNLFGIKAGPGWKGAVAEVTTTEVVEGQAHKVKAKFRAYASYAESFNDYARLMTQNPRYRQVLAQGDSAQGFARELQRAGYATDPHYADKLTRTINTTVRVQRAAG
jgi:peptidoglycan hydrolase FlgJ